MYWYLLSTEFNQCVIRAAAFALIASGIGSLIQNSRILYEWHHGDWQRDYGASVSSFTMVYTSYATLPAFVMVFVLNSEISRWCKTVQVVGHGQCSFCALREGWGGLRLLGHGTCVVAVMRVMQGRCAVWCDKARHLAAPLGGVGRGEKGNRRCARRVRVARRGGGGCGRGDSPCSARLLTLASSRPPPDPPSPFIRASSCLHLHVRVLASCTRAF